MSYRKENGQVMLTNETLGDLALKKLQVGWKAGVEAAIHEILQGRIINNFEHIPEVVRALEWVIMDLRSLEPPHFKGKP
jgi:hypothetical protein